MRWLLLTIAVVLGPIGIARADEEQAANPPAKTAKNKSRTKRVFEDPVTGKRTEQEVPEAADRNKPADLPKTVAKEKLKEDPVDPGQVMVEQWMLNNNGKIKKGDKLDDFAKEQDRMMEQMQRRMKQMMRRVPGGGAFKGVIIEDGKRTEITDPKQMMDFQLRVQQMLRRARNGRQIPEETAPGLHEPGFVVSFPSVQEGKRLLQFLSALVKNAAQEGISQDCDLAVDDDEAVVTFRGATDAKTLRDWTNNLVLELGRKVTPQEGVNSVLIEIAGNASAGRAITLLEKILRHAGAKQTAAEASKQVRLVVNPRGFALVFADMAWGRRLLGMPAGAPPRNDDAP